MTGQPQVYVIGDTHVRGNMLALSAFIAELLQRPPAYLIILGDLFDYWLETASVQRRHAAMLAEIRQLRDAGWQVDLLVGNREILAGRRLVVAAGVRLRWPAIHLAIGGRSIRIVHGDRLCADPGYHLMFAFLHGFWMRSCSLLMPDWLQDRTAGDVRESSEQRNHAPQQWSHAATIIDPGAAGGRRHADFDNCWAHSPALALQPEGK